MEIFNFGVLKKYLKSGWLRRWLQRWEKFSACNWSIPYFIAALIFNILKGFLVTVSIMIFYENGQLQPISIACSYLCINIFILIPTKDATNIHTIRGCINDPLNLLKIYMKVCAEALSFDTFPHYYISASCYRKTVAIVKILNNLEILVVSGCSTAFVE